MRAIMIAMPGRQDGPTIPQRKYSARPSCSGPDQTMCMVAARRWKRCKWGKDNGTYEG